MPLEFSDQGKESKWIRFHLGPLYWENWPESWFTQFPNPNHLVFSRVVHFWVVYRDRDSPRGESMDWRVTVLSNINKILNSGILKHVGCGILLFGDNTFEKGEL